MSNSSIVHRLEETVQNGNKDRLSSLPDDTLISILQLIDMNDATRTCILSRRWRKLAPYSFFTDVDLDAKKTSLTDLKTRCISYNYVKPKFLNWVHQVLTSHCASFINDFRFCFPLSQADSNLLCMWIKFAISKGVKKLELDCSVQGFFDFRESPRLPRCSFPSTFLKSSSSKNETSNLTSLCLKFINISGELLELLLSYFHHLERLYVENSNDLLNLKIINSSGKLKYLAIRWCNFIKKVEIHAVNLLSFEFSHTHDSYEPSVYVNMIYASVPSLVDAWFWWWHCDCLHPYFSQMHCFAAQLTKLSLHLDLVKSHTYGYSHLLSFPNVKYLELQVIVGRYLYDWGHMNLLQLKCYAEACPVLDNLKLQIYWSCDCSDLSDSRSDVDFDSDYDLEMDLDSDSGTEEYSLEEVKHWLEEKEGFNATLPLLRKLEWTAAFSNHVEAEYELALYFIKNAIMLEKFICDPRFKDLNWDPWKPQPIDLLIEDVRRQRARQLATAIPSCIDVTIL